MLNTAMIFSNPPLVELVAELRWVPGISGPSNPDGSVTVQFPLAFVEESLEIFRRSIAAKGFTISERLIPAGFLTLPFTVVQRFRRSSNEENYAYQIGVGVFSANALPPYRDWESFRPIVREGVETLLASRHAADRANISVVLRYLDVFSNELTEGRKSFDFLNEVLGITLRLPTRLIERALNPRELRAGLQVSLPLNDGLAMNIGVQDGSAGGKTGVLMTTEVFTIQPVNADLDLIMQKFEKSHDNIRVTFLDLTTKIHDKMKPAR
jgi:uncharacterized protein (TIGR04255 family)